LAIVEDHGRWRELERGEGHYSRITPLTVIIIIVKHVVGVDIAET
jgi:hypothetical protein